jgi:hypothetical protein
MPTWRLQSSGAMDRVVLRLVGHPGRGLCRGGGSQLSVYCTGDWGAARRAEPAAAVTLIRP